MVAEKAISLSPGFDIQECRFINGKKTEFVFQPFVNRWFLFITQHGKLANFYSVQFDVRQEHAARISIDDPAFHQSIPVTMTCNFGADKDEIRSGIQFLVNKSKLNKCPLDFVISLDLNEINSPVLTEVAKVLDEIIA